MLYPCSKRRKCYHQVVRILVFGGTGRTGQVIYRAAKALGHDVVAPSHREGDLSNTKLVTDLIFSTGARAVINCAAISSLEACLDNPLRAHLVNALAPGAMALACRHTGARFIHLSTDYVLDGRRAGKKGEYAKCHPLSIYGESKREGEQQVGEAYSESLILRVSWIMGNPLRPSFVEETLRKAKQGLPLAAIADKYSMPTDVEDIARIALGLICSPLSGILHVCSSGEVQSWHSCATFALQAAHEFGILPTMPDVIPQKLSEASFFREVRPRHTAMDNSSLVAAGMPMPTAEETLLRVVRRYGAFLHK